MFTGSKRFRVDCFLTVLLVLNYLKLNSNSGWCLSPLPRYTTLTLGKIKGGHENRPYGSQIAFQNSCSPYWWDICSAWLCCFGNTGRYLEWRNFCSVVPMAESRCLGEWCWNPQKEPSCWRCDSGGPKPMRRKFNECLCTSFSIQKSRASIILQNPMKRPWRKLFLSKLVLKYYNSSFRLNSR